MAMWTLEVIFGIRPPTSFECQPFTVVDEAGNTKIISAERVRKFRKAHFARINAINRKLYFRQLSLKIEAFFIKRRLARIDRRLKALDNL